MATVLAIGDAGGGMPEPEPEPKVEEKETNKKEQEEEEGGQSSTVGDEHGTRIV